MKKRLATRLSVLIPALAGACAGLALAACNINLAVNPIYQDAARNWISDFGFGVARSSTDSGWAFDYQGATGDSFAYMSLSDTGAAVSGSLPEGLDPAAEAYRLSINNLMPDPDFSGSATPAACWSVGHVGTSVSNPSAPVIASNPNAQLQHGRCLSYSRTAVDQYISFLLSPTLLNSGGGGTGPAAGSMYQVNFLLYCTSSQLNYSPDLNDRLMLGTAPNALNDVRLQTQAFAAPTQDYYLYYGPNGIQTTGYIDDIRILRKAIPLYLSLELKLSDSSPSFISGRYVLSVWVKNDPSASYLLGAGAAAPYQARSVTLEIRGLSRSDGGASGVFHPADMVAGWSEWTRLDLEFAPGDKLAIDQGDANPVFSLKISPADLSSATGLDAATILVAQPSLSFRYD